MSVGMWGEVNNKDSGPHSVAALDLRAPNQAQGEEEAEETEVVLTAYEQQLRTQVAELERRNKLSAGIVVEQLRNLERLNAENADLTAKLTATQSELHELRIKVGLGAVNPPGDVS